jgi:hypothetical protein
MEAVCVRSCGIGRTPVTRRLLMARDTVHPLMQDLGITLNDQSSE